MELQLDQYCYGCGAENPIGLKLKFEYNTEGVTSTFNPTKEYQGFVQMLHGGIISTLLDEVMAHTIIAKGYRAVTVRMEVFFKKPTIIGIPIVLKGKILNESGKLITTSGEIFQDSEITAMATADYIIK